MSVFFNDWYRILSRPVVGKEPSDSQRRFNRSQFDFAIAFLFHQFRHLVIQESHCG